MTNSAIYVVIPVYNEAGVLRQTLTPLVEAGYTVVVVDDGSTDGSALALEQMKVVVLHHAVNLGQGAALETGMDYARTHGAEAVVHFDADGQHRWEQIPEFIAPIERGEADVVLGSRFLRREDAAGTPLVRRIVLRIGIIVSAMFTGLWLSDTHNGFRALSPKALDEIHLREDGFAHATEILSSIRRNRLRYIEVPTAIRYSAYSRAKGQSFWNSFNIVIDLLLEKLFR
jgi:glycosyltransferase involved in cell wall biosynthesis